MRQFKILAIYCLTLFIMTTGQAQIVSQSVISGKSTYNNAKYRFSVEIPDTWKLYGQILDDPKEHRAVVDWGLPLLYSELEKTEIENSISITAFHKTTIRSVEDLITAELLKRNPVETSFEVDSTCSNCRIIYYTHKGLNYKGKVYFEYKNEIGYVITFMATPGTFDKNLQTFEKFYSSITFS